MSRFLVTGGAGFIGGHIAETLVKNGHKVRVLDNFSSGKMMNLAEVKGKIDLVINIPKNIEKEELDNDYLIRRKAVDFNVPLITNIQLAKRFVEAFSRTSLDDLKIKSWNEYV